MKPRRVVVICDISGSMDRYSRLLLQFVHTIEKGWPSVEVFVFGTRLTRITRQSARPQHRRRARAGLEARSRTGPAAPASASRCRRSTPTWARRVLRPGCGRPDHQRWLGPWRPELLGTRDGAPAALVLPADLAQPAPRLAELQPLTRGMQAALPYMDDFMPVHNLDSLELLADHLSNVGEFRPVRKQAPLEFVNQRMATV